MTDDEFETKREAQRKAQEEYLTGALERQQKLLKKVREQQGSIAGGAYAPVSGDAGNSAQSAGGSNDLPPADGSGV